MAAYTTVYCELMDCIHYQPEPSHPKKCRCGHPEKPHYMKEAVCPLYRMDWQKKFKSAGLVNKPKPWPKY